mmetsp:Transcript_51778/g.133526  ORF Transcript_51778/g.133526 Transcript_51778/m.133526 type:complete len:218 (+) Transcript_51778:322-975(+)
MRLHGYVRVVAGQPPIAVRTLLGGAQASEPPRERGRGGGGGGGSAAGAAGGGRVAEPTRDNGPGASVDATAHGEPDDAARQLDGAQRRTPGRRRGLARLQHGHGARARAHDADAALLHAQRDQPDERGGGGRAGRDRPVPHQHRLRQPPHGEMQALRLHPHEGLRQRRQLHLLPPLRSGREEAAPAGEVGKAAAAAEEGHSAAGGAAPRQRAEGHVS